jgi:hypothetical protein
MAKRKKRGAASRSARKTRKKRIPPQRQDGPSAWGDKDLEQVKNGYRTNASVRQASMASLAEFGARWKCREFVLLQGRRQDCALYVG